MTRLDELFRRIATEEDELIARAATDERLIARLRAAPPGRHRKRRFILPLAAALSLLGVALAVVLARNDSVLAVKVGDSGGSPLLGAWLGAPEEHALPLEFSDGSRLELSPRSRARLVELERAGARVELGSGTIKVQVVPSPAAAWRLDAGPFGVRVTGTSFELSYHPEQDVLELFLEEGHVELTGCVFGNGRKLIAGQSVRASCKRQNAEVGFGRPPRAPELDGRAKGSPGNGAPPAARQAPETPTRPEVAPDRERRVESPGSPEPPAAAWLPLARRGAYREAYAALGAQGFEAECARASAESLTLLSDVARYGGASRHAEYALVTLRKRFPRSHEAALAAFALGRIEFDDRRAFARAATWFRAYLAERPSGPMAREALGRLIEASNRAGDHAGARVLATRYLSEYPSGPHAELASRVVSSP